MASAKLESYELTFRLFAFYAVIFCLDALKPKILDLIAGKYFLFCKLSTLYPGYLLKGEKAP